MHRSEQYKMFSFIPATRQERRALYMQQYQTQQEVVHISHADFYEKYPQLYRQIQVDCKRSLFTCFEKESMKKYFQSLENAAFLDGFDIDSAQYDGDFRRKCYSIFYAYLLDVIATNPGFNYFQGFTQILAVMFFVFLKDELLIPTNEFYATLPNCPSGELFVFDRNPAEALENYEKLIQISVCLGRRSFGPQNSPDIQTLYVYQFLAFEPTLRFLDAELYLTIVRKLQISSEILQSTLLSGAYYISHTLESSLRFLDIAVLGDWHLQLFIAAAALVIAIRERNYQLDGEDFYAQALTSLQGADNEVPDFADKVIRLALAGYFMSFVAERFPNGPNWRYIHENFSFSKVYGRIRELRDFETIIGRIPKFFDEEKAGREGIAEGFIDIDRDRGHYIGIVQKSIGFQVKNGVEPVKMPKLEHRSTNPFRQAIKSVSSRIANFGVMLLEQNAVPSHAPQAREEQQRPYQVNAQDQGASADGHEAGVEGLEERKECAEAPDGQTLEAVERLKDLAEDVAQEGQVVSDCVPEQPEEKQPSYNTD